MSLRIIDAKRDIAKRLGIPLELISQQTVYYLFDDDIPESTNGNMTEEHPGLYKLAEYESLISKFESIAPETEVKGVSWDLLKSIVFSKFDKTDLKSEFPTHSERGIFYKYLKCHGFNKESALGDFNKSLSHHDAAKFNKAKKYKK